MIDNLGWLVDSDEELPETTSSKGTSVLQKNKTKKSILTFSVIKKNETSIYKIFYLL